MELLIKDLLISFSLIHSSITELYRSTESSKGIYTVFIYDFSNLILNIITNDFINLYCIDKFYHYINIGDLIAVLGSIDSVSGSVDSFFFFYFLLFYSFSSFQTFYIPFFQDSFLLFSSYFFKGPIY